MLLHRDATAAFTRESGMAAGSATAPVRGPF
jgi:hypothetical protein